MDFVNLDVSFQPKHCKLLIDVVNYICTGLSKISSLSELRDGTHLARVIVVYERCNRWQESKIVNLFFKLKDEAITPYQFINGWLDQYYHCGLEIVRPEFRFAQDDELAQVAILLINVLYNKRKTLSNDLKLCLEAAWFDLKSLADSVVLSMRTKALSLFKPIQSNPVDGVFGGVDGGAHGGGGGVIGNDSFGAHSCAQQLFSGQTIYQHEHALQKMGLMVQQQLISEQSKRLENQELISQSHLQKILLLSSQLAQMKKENSQLKLQFDKLFAEHQWQKSITNEQNEQIKELKEYNYRLQRILSVKFTEEFDREHNVTDNPSCKYDCLSASDLNKEDMKVLKSFINGMNTSNLDLNHDNNENENENDDDDNDNNDTQLNDLNSFNKKSLTIKCATKQFNNNIDLKDFNDDNQSDEFQCNDVNDGKNDDVSGQNGTHSLTPSSTISISGPGIGTSQGSISTPGSGSSASNADEEEKNGEEIEEEKNADEEENNDEEEVDDDLYVDDDDDDEILIDISNSVSEMMIKDNELDEPNSNESSLPQGHIEDLIDLSMIYPTKDVNVKEGKSSNNNEEKNSENSIQSEINDQNTYNENPQSNFGTNDNRICISPI